ncbi:unnamed protein product, partial [Cladocopium goreaui]
DVACLSHPKLEIEDTSSSPVSSSSSSVDSEASIASIPPTLSPVAPVDATDALAVPNWLANITKLGVGFFATLPQVSKITSWKDTACV